MKKTIKLKVKSTITYAEQDNEDIEIVTEGEMYIKRDKIYITYEESEISGMENSKTVVVINNDDYIEMLRFGSINSKMQFKLKKETNTVYKTQYGNFQMIINTKDINNTIDFEKGNGFLVLDYKLQVKGLSKSVNHLKLSLL